MNGYDVDDPKSDGYAERLRERADDRHTYAGTDLDEHDELHDLGRNHAAIERERPAPPELKAWDL